MSVRRPPFKLKVNQTVAVQNQQKTSVRAKKALKDIFCVTPCRYNAKKHNEQPPHKHTHTIYIYTFIINYNFTCFLLCCSLFLLRLNVSMIPLPPPLPPSALVLGREVPPLPPSVIVLGRELPPLPPSALVLGRELPPLPPSQLKEEKLDYTTNTNFQGREV